jgi:Cthe_2314-like HEPN
MDLSEEDASKLLENRVNFKLYNAEQHLNNLKTLNQNGISMRQYRGRVTWEMEIESFLFHISGVYDSLLVRINDKLELKLKGKDIKYHNIKTFLTYLNEQSLLTSLHNFYNNSSVQKLTEWRNYVTHYNLLNILMTGSSDEPEVFIHKDPDKKPDKKLPILFLEKGLKDVKDLVQDFMNNHPRLK